MQTIVFRNSGCRVDEESIEARGIPNDEVSHFEVLVAICSFYCYLTGTVLYVQTCEPEFLSDHAPVQMHKCFETNESVENTSPFFFFLLDVDDR